MLKRITKLAGRCENCGEPVELDAQVLPFWSDPAFFRGVLAGILLVLLTMLSWMLS